MSKDELIKNVRKWISLDNEIRTLQKEQKKRRDKKKEVSESLIDFMKENEVDCFEIKDGNLSYVKQNVKKPITKKNLLEILSKYYDGDIFKATEMNEFIMNNREEVVRESIQRRINCDDKSTKSV
jgi:hypothetical protein